MRGIRTLDPSCGPQPSNPFRKSSPAAAALWNKSNPVARAQNLESETKYLSSYFADTALASSKEDPRNSWRPPMQTLGESQNGEKRICHRLITFIGQDRPYRPLDLIELR